MSVPRLRWWQWFLLGCAAVVLLLPAGLAAVAPALAPIPKQVLPGVQKAPPLPDRETPLPGFQDLLDPLPLVVRDLPDAASQEVVAAYDRATLLESQPVLEMLAAAKRAIPMPTDAKELWNTWLDMLAAAPREPVPLPKSVLKALRDDPQNGDRLSNLAVALYFTSNIDGTAIPAEYSPGAHQAESLLDLVLQEFPNSRGVVLNFVFVFSEGARSFDYPSLEPKIVLNDWLRVHPNDLTALQMAAWWDHWVAPELLERVRLNAIQLTGSQNPLQQAFAYSLLGDLQSMAANEQRSDSPFKARQTALRALEEYDEALKFSDDPSIFSARAATLQLLGDTNGAIATLQRAIQLEPNSVPLRTQLVELYFMQDGSDDERTETLRKAQREAKDTLTLALAQWNPFLSEVQFHSAQLPGNWGIPAYTWLRPHRTYLIYGPLGGADGFIASGDAIQRFEVPPTALGDYLGLTASRAVNNAVMASVALGDPSKVAEDLARFQQLANDPRWNTSTQAEFEDWGRLQWAIPAAQLVADPSLGNAADALEKIRLAANVLRFFGLFSRAAEVCRTAEYWQCVAENEYLAGNVAEAHEAFSMPVTRFLTDGEGFDLLKAGMVAEKAGYQERAQQLYLMQAAGGSWYGAKVAGRARLGDMQLGMGNAAAAMEYYDQAIDLWESSRGNLSEGGPESIVIQRLRNNRGVARLMALGPAGKQPDCTGSGMRGMLECEAALADFKDALRSDPLNPVYLLGKGWVERLQGNSQASIQTLEQAIQSDPTLFPGLNDLGVLAAHAGDHAGARKYFEAALAANPEYDLAMWNLGVLEMQRGIGGVLRAQAYLARANLQNPSLVSSDLAYRFDDNVYRVEFTERSRPGAGWSFGSASSLAATTLGVVTLFALILAAVKYAGANTAQDVANTWTDRVIAWEERKFGHQFSWPIGSGRQRWLPLLITLPILAFVTSWSAWRSNPQTAAATVALALFAALTAVIAHESGHMLVAMKLKAELLPAQWGPGALISLILLPFNLSAGPFPGERVQGTDDKTAWWVHLGGPMANLLVALGAYALYLVQPMPGLRLIVLTQLAAMSYTLLPFEPLDGAALSRHRPRVLSVLTFFVVVAGALFSLNKI